MDVIILLFIFLVTGYIVVSWMRVLFAPSSLDDLQQHITDNQNVSINDNRSNARQSSLYSGNRTPNDGNSSALNRLGMLWDDNDSYGFNFSAPSSRSSWSHNSSNNSSTRSNARRYNSSNIRSSSGFGSSSRSSSRRAKSHSSRKSFSSRPSVKSTTRRSSSSISSKKSSFKASRSSFKK